MPPCFSSTISTPCTAASFSCPEASGCSVCAVCNGFVNGHRSTTLAQNDAHRTGGKRSSQIRITTMRYGTKIPECVKWGVDYFRLTAGRKPVAIKRPTKWQGGTSPVGRLLWTSSCSVPPQVYTGLRRVGLHSAGNLVPHASSAAATVRPCARQQRRRNLRGCKRQDEWVFMERWP